MDIWKSPSTRYRRDKKGIEYYLHQKCSKFTIIKIRKSCQYAGYIYSVVGLRLRGLRQD